MGVSARRNSCATGKLFNIASGIVAFFCCVSAEATLTVRDHIQNVSKAEYQASMNIWLDGVIGALLASNADLKLTRKVSPLFCMPSGSSINSADAMKLIDKEVGSHRWKDSVPLTTILLDALQRTYPCN